MANVFNKVVCFAYTRSGSLFTRSSAQVYIHFQWTFRFRYYNDRRMADSYIKVSIGGKFLLIMKTELHGLVHLSAFGWQCYGKHFVLLLKVVPWNISINIFFNLLYPLGWWWKYQIHSQVTLLVVVLQQEGRVGMTVFCIIYWRLGVFIYVYIYIYAMELWLIRCIILLSGLCYQTLGAVLHFYYYM